MSIWLGWAIARCVGAVHFDQQIGGHLKRAADANTLVLATQELEQAQAGMDARNLCTSPGYTSVLWRTPDEDVGFWCANITATLDDVRTASSDADIDRMTESNMLIKVRETLLDHSSYGDEVTVPMGISVYPHNGMLAWLGFLSFAGMLITGVTLLIRWLT